MGGARPIAVGLVFGAISGFFGIGFPLGFAGLRG